ncbi:hypothetical protein HK103_003575 [Boothiomyces macroporosus]|uniref:Ferrochelatase n=1 Tax=Boothiomyces macroporosus TaxID=261099 RepID=A0AAD5Y3Y1_9FUNG|nr:hypothetical protein HK103_003575 [Boothiomyces macroporosus]
MLISGLKGFRRALATANKPKTAIFLMNMGGPHDLDHVEPFLTNLFSDGDLIPIPFQDQLAPWISKRRVPKIKEQYAKIGGGSPIRMWTEKQGEMLAKKMDLLSPSTAPHKSYVGFRYAAPLTEETIVQMKQDGVDRAVAFTLYPQYSCSTTGSSLNELHRILKIHDPNHKIHWSVIDRWATHPGLVNTFAEHIKTSLAEYPEEERKDVVLLFSAHSLPMSVVNRGDSYPGEVAATVSKVMEVLGHSNPYRLVWQSQVGPSAWLGPKTDDAIVGYAKKGVKNLLVVPIAFVSDHIETLFELDLEYGHLAKENNIGYKRVESLNADPLFIDALSDILDSHLKSGSHCSNQFTLRCPSCTSAKCRHTKNYFSRDTVKKH